MDQETKTFDRFLRRPTRRLYGQIARQQYDFVWRVSLRATGNSEDAADVTHDLFLALLREPPRAGSVRSVRGYLATRVMSLVRRHWKAAARRRKRERQAAERLTDAGATLSVEDLDALRAAVERLPERVRTIVELRYLVGLKNKEVAGLVGLSERSVEDDLRRGRELLKKQLSSDPLVLLPLVGVGGAASAGAVQPAPAELLASIVESREVVRTLGAVEQGARFFARKGSLAPTAALLLVGVTVGGAWYSGRSVDRSPAAADLPALLEPVGSVVPEPARTMPVVAETPSEREPVVSRLRPEGTAQAVRTAAIHSAVIHGRVTDAETGAPIGAATVSVDGTTVTSVADESGRYVIESVALGRRRLTAGAPGFLELIEDVEIDPSVPFEKNFVLDPTLDVTVVVLGENGVPLEDATVTRAAIDGSYPRDESAPRSTDQHGVAVISGISRLRPQQLRAEKEGYKTSWRRPGVPGIEEETLEFTFALEKEQLNERVVEGTVTDSEGAPLRGITVTWATAWGGSEERVTVVTDPDGTYRLRFSTEHETCHLSAFGSGWAPGLEENVSPGSGDSPQVVDFVLMPAHVLRGRVADESGEPIAEARVLALADRRLLHAPSTHPALARRAESDSAGFFLLEDLPGPTVTVRVQGPSGEGWSVLEQDGVVVDQSVELTLQELGVIRGRVISDASGEPIPAFKVRIKPRGKYWPYGFSYSRTQQGESFASAGGEFLLDDLPRGERFDLTVEAPGYGAERLEDVAVASVDQAESHEVAIEAASSLEGQVVDRVSGEPVAGASVLFAVWKTAADPFDSWAWQQKPGYERTATNTAGTFHFQESQPGTLLIVADDYVRRLVRPNDRDVLMADGILVVPMEHGARVRGIYYEQGRPTANAYVDLIRRRPPTEPRGPGYERYGGMQADASGGFESETVPPGEYELHQHRPRSKDAGRPTAMRLFKRIHLSLHETKNVTFGDDLGELVVDGRLLDAAGGPIQGVDVSLVPLFASAYTEYTSSITPEGYFAVAHLHPGRYELSAAEGGRRTKLTQLDLRRPVTLELVAPDELGE